MRNMYDQTEPMMPSQLLLLFMDDLGIDFNFEKYKDIAEKEIFFTKKGITYNYEYDLNFRAYFEELFNFWIVSSAENGKLDPQLVAQFNPENIEHGLRSLAFQYPSGISKLKRSLSE